MLHYLRENRPAPPPRVLGPLEAPPLREAPPKPPPGRLEELLPIPPLRCEKPPLNEPEEGRFEFGRDCAFGGMPNPPMGGGTPGPGRGARGRLAVIRPSIKPNGKDIELRRGGRTGGGGGGAYAARRERLPNRRVAAISTTSKMTISKIVPKEMPPLCRLSRSVSGRCAEAAPFELLSSKKAL